MNRNKSDNESRLLIENQYFLNKSSLAKYSIGGPVLARISFVNCNFEDLKMLGNIFGSCNFQNCTFNQFATRKAKFSGCHFKDCKITNSDMTRAEFDHTYFKNCEFIGVNLAASEFCDCKLKSTRFFKSNLNFIIVVNVKVWKSKEWVEIKDFSSFEKQLDE